MRFIKNLFSFIIYLLMIIVFCATVYFCLDVFGIIEVPKEYSIASIFYSEIETIAATGENFEEVVDINKKIVKEPIYGINNIANTVVENTNTNTVDLNEILEELTKANEQNQKQGNLIDQNSINTSSYRKFYYSQLDDYAKTIYDQLYMNKENLKTGTYTVDFGRTFNELLNTEGGEKILDDDFQLAINALIFDNPEFFYLDVTKFYMSTKETIRLFSRTYNVSIGAHGGNYLVNDFSDETALREAISKIDSAKDYLVDRVYNNDIDKIRAVHDYLVDTIDYDGSKESTAYTAYGALVDKKAVCEGYAKAFKYVLDDMKIPCILVRGVAKNNDGESEGHAWNYVKVDDQWYAVDVTWDDPVITGIGKISEERKYKYFLKGANEFFENHYEDGTIMDNISFQYPRLSVINYD